jgi:hypothetical protein
MVEVEVEVEVEESLGLEETRKEEEEGVRIRGLGGARRRVGVGQWNRAVVISRLRTEGKSSLCIERERPGIAHLLYLHLQVTSLSRETKIVRLQVRLDVAGRNPSCQRSWRCRRNENGVLPASPILFPSRGKAIRCILIVIRLA